MDKRFKLRFSLSSFQICRPKKPSSLPKSPLPPSTLLFSPLNPKPFDISFPSFKFPDPPPSTPIHPSFNLHASPTHVVEDKLENNENNPHRKTYNSPASGGSDGKPPNVERSKKEREKNQEKKPIKVSRRKKIDTTNARSPESVFPVSKPVMGKATESFAVVKRSEDPYEDFKRSMLEMILEKEMFEAKDLEELLLCFLSLNSTNYHALIVEAFSDIWELLFHKSP